MIEIEDVKDVAKQLKVNLTDSEVEEVLELYTEYENCESYFNWLWCEILETCISETVSERLV